MRILVDALVADHEVRVLDDLSSGQRSYVHDDAHLIVGDVRDDEVVREAMAGVDVVQANLLAARTDATGEA